MRTRLFAVVPMLAALWALPASAAPERVVSMNLCTDQLALMMGAPGQVVSVSHWSARESASNMAREASRLPLNRGAAEQVYLMRPDLVLAGTFTNRTSVDLLKRLGVRVETFPAANSIADVRTNIRRLGALLGRNVAAAEVERAFDARLGELRTRAEALPRRAAAYHYPNSYTSGAETLAHEVLETAALDNAAAALGLRGATQLDLERLVMLRPFLVHTEPLAGTRTGRSYETAHHPALSGLAQTEGSAVLAQRWQVCGTPFVVRAIEALIETREPAGSGALRGHERAGGGQRE